MAIRRTGGYLGSGEYGSEQETATDIMEGMDIFSLGPSSHYQIDPSQYQAFQPTAPDMGGVQGATDALAAAGQNLQAPTAEAADPFAGATLDTSGQQQWADMQRALASQYQNIASGAAPSAAEIMLKQAQERNAANIMGVAASQRGSNYGGSQREMLGALGDANLQAGQQMAAVRAQEQERAMSGLAGLAGQARGAEMQMAETQANFLQQAGLQGAEFRQQIAMLNPQLRMQTMQLAQNYMEAAMRGKISEVEAAITIQQIAADAYNANQTNLVNIDVANMQAENDAGGGLFG